MPTSSHNSVMANVDTAVIIKSSIDEATSEGISVSTGQKVQIYCSPKMGKNDIVSISRTPDKGKTWIYVSEILSSGKNSTVIEGPIAFRLTKSKTKSPITVYLDS